jgi:transposase-like protein
LVESAAEYFPEARWRRRMVHFYRNVFIHGPAGKPREVTLMPKAILRKTLQPPGVTRPTSSPGSAI